MNQLGLFAKFWQPGTVKTRLAAAIGDESACHLYRSFLFHLIERLRDSADCRTVVFSPPERATEFQKTIPPSWKLWPQSSGDLGSRMSSFFRDQFETHAGLDSNDSLQHKIAVIGGDCPLLDPRIIRSAFELLDEVQVVLGPSPDGGYYLIAMRQKCYDLFSGVPWSTATVYSRTVQRLKELNVPFRTLPPRSDVDDLESLLVLKSEMENRKVVESGRNEMGLLPLDALDLQLLNEVHSAVTGRIVESD